MERWISTEQAARLAGITPSALRHRRNREPHHPAVVRVGMVALYERDAFGDYLDAWTDGRCR